MAGIEHEETEKIVVLGIGIDGCEAVNRMIVRRAEGVEFAAAAEDEHVLKSCMAAKKFSVNAIQDSKKFFDDNFHDTSMILIVNMSGSSAERNFAFNTAHAAKSSGALTLGIPVKTENNMQDFRDYFDAVIISCADDTEPYMTAEGIVDIITKAGFVNLDFLDVKNMLHDTGAAYFVTGYGEGMNRGEEAMRQIMDIHGNNIRPAKSILMNITTSADVALSELSDIAEEMLEHILDSNASLIWCHTIDEAMNDGMKVTAVFGMNDKSKEGGYDSMSESYRCHETLLRDAVKISHRYEEIYRITGEKFNVFQVLDIEEKEKFICRVLSELLSPSGSHNQGSLFLRPFVRKVPGLNDIPDSELDDAEVSCEYTTRKNRRIDIAIKTANYFVAIEVKINAGDSDNQCRDYYEEAKRHCADEEHAKIVYLTPYGNEPAPESASGEEICISFEKDIHEWLEECLSYSEIEYAVSVREIMRQFLKTTERFTNQMKEDKKMELVELITKSSENFKAAFELRESLKSAVEAMRKKFLEDVCGLLKTWGYDCEELDYAPKKRNYALIRYDKLPDTAVCIGSGKYETWVSYFLTGGDKAKTVDFLARLKEDRGFDFLEKLKEDRGDDCIAKCDGDFFGWEICRRLNGRDSPNFYPDDPNEAMIELCCDDEKFNDFVELSAVKIREFLEFSPEN